MSETATARDRIMLVDGHSVAFRAYHALPASLADSRGRPANALYGFMNILFRVLNDHRPTHLAVTFDRGRTFREALYPAYKASRGRAPADFEPQVAALQGLLAALRAPVFESDGFEADDLLATLAAQALALRFPVDILSGDLDILQLVGAGTRVIAPGKTFAEPVVYDAARVRERYGIDPQQLGDWKALVGDASDEIPGVAGIGQKSATTLLQQRGSLDAIYRDLDAIPSVRMRTALVNGRDAAAISRRLVTLRDDAPVRLDLESSRITGFDRVAAATAVRGLGFAALADRISKWVP